MTRHVLPALVTVMIVVGLYFILDYAHINLNSFHTVVTTIPTSQSNATLKIFTSKAQSGSGGAGGDDNGTINSPFPMWKGWQGAGYYYFPEYANQETYLPNTVDAQDFAAMATGCTSGVICNQTGVCNTTTSLKISTSKAQSGGNGAGRNDNGSLTSPWPMWEGWQGVGYYYFPTYANKETYLNTTQSAQNFSVAVTGCVSGVICNQTGVCRT